jgi:hypothetical protein
MRRAKLLDRRRESGKLSGARTTQPSAGAVSQTPLQPANESRLQAFVPDRPGLLPDWAQRARHLDHAVLEIGFHVHPDFYFGPENHFTEDQWERLREPLHVPAIEHHAFRGHAPCLLTRSLEQAAEELVRYYSDVVRLIEKHAKKVIDHRHYFTLQPILYSPGGEFELRYFTSGHWETAALTLERLEDGRDGLHHDDVDEHWRVEVIGSGDRLYIRVTDPDAESGVEELECVSCDRSSVIQQVGPLRERTRRLRQLLSGAFPVDYWSLEWLYHAWGVPHHGWMDEVDAFGSLP